MAPHFFGLDWGRSMSAEASAISTRWGDGRRADVDFAREHILDAAFRCYSSRSVMKTTVEHIAREAKVTRTTIYRYFKNRDEVLTAVVTRESGRLVQWLIQQCGDIENFGEFVIQALSSVVLGISRFPMFGLMLSESDVLVTRLCMGSDDIRAVVMGFMRDHYQRAREAGQLRAGLELEALADWLMLIGTAHLQAGSMANLGRDELLARFRVFLVPAIMVA